MIAWLDNSNRGIQNEPRWCLSSDMGKKTKPSPSKIMGVLLLSIPLLIAVSSQAFGHGLIWIDRHPATPPTIAAQGGVVVGDALHISFGLVPLAIAFGLGLACMFARKREQTSATDG